MTLYPRPFFFLINLPNSPGQVCILVREVHFKCKCDAASEVSSIGISRTFKSKNYISMQPCDMFAC